MIANYYTLRALALELNSLLTGSTVNTVFSQNKNELVIACKRTTSYGGSADSFVLVLCDPALNALYLRPAFARARKNTIEFFKGVHGHSITGVTIQPGDREIRFSFESRLQLVAQLFGPKANVFLVETEGRVVEAFLRPDEVQGTTLIGPERLEAVTPSEPAAFERRLRSIGHITIFAAVKKNLPLLGSTLVRELLFRSGIADQAAVAELSPDEVSRLFRCYRELIEELQAIRSPRIYIENATPVLFSLIELQTFADQEAKIFPSVHDGIGTFLSSIHRQRHFFGEKTEILRNFDREMARVEKALEAMGAALETGLRARNYETMGKILMANLSLLNKGMKTVTLENVFSPARDLIEIPLDPTLPPAKNAERYFERGKKARHAVAEAAVRKERLDERYEKLQRLREMAEPIQTFEQWKQFASSHGEELAEAGIKTRESREERGADVPFRVFRVEGGFEVWAGKKSDNNDLLTFKYARPNDLWFHARGSSGSHVVLRKGTGKGEVSRRAIEQAAAIAAYYSKMRTSGLVPVAVTERKYVRKSRGAPAGTVKIQREKVVMVKPRLPGDSHHRED